MNTDVYKSLATDAFTYCFTQISLKNNMKRFDHAQDQMVSECVVNYFDIARNAGVFGLKYIKQ